MGHEHARHDTNKMFKSTKSTIGTYQARTAGRQHLRAVGMGEQHRWGTDCVRIKPLE